MQKQQQCQDEEKYLCGVCGELYEEETEEPQIWIQCDLCGQWLHCSCVFARNVKNNFFLLFIIYCKNKDFFCTTNPPYWGRGIV